jgi:hypothetical protein
VYVTSFDTVGLSSVDTQAPTVVRKGTHRWAWWQGKTMRTKRISMRDNATLQTFPATYRFPLNKLEAFAQVGNAIPPLVAKLMLRSETRPSSPSLPHPPPPPAQDQMSPSLRHSKPDVVLM